VEIVTVVTVENNFMFRNIVRIAERKFNGGELMRKLAVFGLIILILSVVAVTLAVVNYMGFRDSAYAAIQDTFLQPGHDWIVNSWVGIGAAGFTYIAAAILGIGIGGGLFLVFIIYGLFWQKLIQGKLLHKTTPTQSLKSSINLQREPAEPEQAPQQIVKSEEAPQVEA